MTIIDMALTKYSRQLTIQEMVQARPLLGADTGAMSIRGEMTLSTMWARWKIILTGFAAGK